MEENNTTYVSILKNTLIRKHQVLEIYSSLMREFEGHLQKDGNEFEVNKFQDFLDKRETLIKQIISLDEGFEGIYDKVQDEIKKDPVLYRDDILIMQQYIPKITDLSVTIEAQEKRNKPRIEELFRSKKKDVKNYKMSQKTVANYYKNSVAAAYTTSDLRRLDQKK